MPDKYRNRNCDHSVCASSDDGVLATVVRTFRIIQQRWKVPVWFLLGFWLIGALYYSFSPRYYRSESEVLIHKVGRDELLVGSEQVLEEVVQKLSSLESEIFSGVSPERRVAFIREKIRINSPGGRPNILRISYPHKNPRLAQTILSTVVDSFKKFVDDEELRRSIDPNSVQKNEFAHRLLNKLQQRKEQMDSTFAEKRIELFVAYKKLQKILPPEIIQTKSLDQLPKAILDSEKNSEPLRLAVDIEEKKLQATQRDPSIATKLLDLKYLDYETKLVGQLTETIADLIVLTNQELEDRSKVSILAKPDFPAIPETPFSLELLFLLTTASGLVFGFGFVFLSDRLDGGFRSLDETEQVLQIPFLGAISVSGNRNARKNDLPNSISPGEDVQSLAALIRSRKRKFRSFAISFSNAGNQNPIATLQLAQAFADQDEKILLIDADLRSSELSRMCCLGEQTGFGDLLDREIVADEMSSTFASVVMWNDRLSLLPAGKFSGDLVSQLSHTRTKRLMSLFEKEYDRVLLFAPNLATAPDAAILAGHVDGCLFSIDPNSKRTPVLKALRTLQKYGIFNIYGMTVQSGLNRKNSSPTSQPVRKAGLSNLPIEDTDSEKRSAA